jgi:hypothetical protein
MAKLEEEEPAEPIDPAHPSESPGAAAEPDRPADA